MKLIGFGEDRPACFDASNLCQVDTVDLMSPAELMQKTKIPNPSGLIFMHNQTVIAEDRWSETLIMDGDEVIVMSAIEGG